MHTLATAGVPAAPVNNVAEMVADPQVRAREMFVELDHPVYGPLKTTGTPLKLSETPGRVRWLAPMPGQDNEEVFIRVLGHSPDGRLICACEGDEPRHFLQRCEPQPGRLDGAESPRPDKAPLGLRTLAVPGPERGLSSP